MSMQEYSYEDYGLVLNKETIETIFNKKGFQPDDEVHKGIELYEADICSSKVFHAPQAGHRPYHFADSAPHSIQT